MAIRTIEVLPTADRQGKVDSLVEIDERTDERGFGVFVPLDGLLDTDALTVIIEIADDGVTFRHFNTTICPLLDLVWDDGQPLKEWYLFTTFRVPNLDRKLRVSVEVDSAGQTRTWGCDARRAESQNELNDDWLARRASSR